MKRNLREQNILFLCEDGCLSQMAEAMAKDLDPPYTRAFSAGVKARVTPSQVCRVMEELGIGLSGLSTKGLDEVPLNEIDLVISFGDADRRCGGLPPRARIERWPIPNPEVISDGDNSGFHALRRKRDEIGKWVFALFLDHWRNVA